MDKFKIYADARGQSMTSLAAQAIQELMVRDPMEKGQEYAAANRRLIERMRNAPDRGTGGTIPWTRDELHER